MKERLVDHLYVNGVLTDAQHGFVTKRSTVSQLLVCVNEWTKDIDSGNLVDILYIDIAKAFDSVSHVKLLKIMKDCGIDGKALLWFRNYLSERTQFVQINDGQSSEVSVTSGVPQGSLLGPILFLIYINSLVRVVKDCKIKLYADDAKIYFSHKKDEPSLIENDLQRIYVWASNMQLRIALEKCSVLHLGRG